MDLEVSCCVPIWVVSIRSCQENREERWTEELMVQLGSQALDFLYALCKQGCFSAFAVLHWNQLFLKKTCQKPSPVKAEKGFCRTCCFHFCLLWKMWQHSLVLSTAKHLWQRKHLSDLLQMQRHMMNVLKWEPCNPWVPIAALLFAWERNWAAWQCSPFQHIWWQMHLLWCKM